MTSMKPMVGLLYNPAVPIVLDHIGARVDYVEVIPDRLWYDFGVRERDRFSHAQIAIDELRRHAKDRAVIGHGIGLSLPSDMPLDAALLDQVAAVHRDLGFEWYSEHMSMFMVPDHAIPDAQAGMGLPIPFDHETLDIIAAKVRHMTDALGIRMLMENGTIFSEVPDPDMTEPEFFNRLHAEAGSGMLLDLHNLYANTLNLGVSAEEYLAALNPEIVVEVHIAGGDWLKGHYTDSHSHRTPPEVWGWLEHWAPRFPNLAAITFEYHESYHKRIGLGGVAQELELMHDLVQRVADARMAEAA